MIGETGGLLCPFLLTVGRYLSAIRRFEERV